MQLQQQQQQQLLKAIPQQRSQLQQQQFQAQNLPLRSPVKPGYEPGMTTILNSGESLLLSILLLMPRRSGVFLCMEVADKQLEFFLRMCGTVRYATASQDEVLKRLWRFCPGFSKSSMKVVLWKNFFMLICPVSIKIRLGKLSWTMQKQYRKASLKQLRVVREGQLRIVFSPDLKICSWEFCARRHEELIPRRLLIPQVTDQVV
ncbi:Transcriptional corepressor SEUSS [Vitis vinifera]|uniref:Transcriptional corepressor SEUSS n=1 Tax=Vitis vinifera TaxID=29760 RepID=A0A438HKT4_VITVI|nr:Transcriptional corepressor SEUSS [Vitis vinifera]